MPHSLQQPTQLGIHAHLSALRNVNTVDQTFDALLSIHVQWMEEGVAEEGGVGWGPSAAGGKPWEPVLLFTNAAPDLNVLHSFTVRTRPTSVASRRPKGKGGAQAQALVSAMHTTIVSGRFAETFNVRQFPLDVQRLRVHVKLINCPSSTPKQHQHPQSSGNDSRSIAMVLSPPLLKPLQPPQPLPSITRQPPRLPLLKEQEQEQAQAQAEEKEQEQSPQTHVPWYDRRYDLSQGSAYMARFMDSSSWEVVEDVRVDIPQAQACAAAVGGRRRHLVFCKFSVCVTLARRPSHYLWQFVFPVSMQVLMAFIAFLAAHSELVGKTQVTVSIVLTMFAVRFSSLQYVPAVASLTYLDAYFVFSTLYVGVIMVQNAVVYLVARHIDNTAANKLNVVTGVLLFIGWLVTQVTVYGVMMSRTLREMLQQQQLLQERCRCSNDASAPASAPASPPNPNRNQRVSMTTTEED